MVRWKKSAVATVGDSAHHVTTPFKEEEAGEWERMFERLKTFKKAKGHCQADQEASGDAALGRWVMSQRRHFKAFAGKEQYTTSCLTSERVQKLQDLGVDLGVGGGSNSSSSSGVNNEPEETRRPAKKRKKSLQVVRTSEATSAEPEEREQASTAASASVGGGERQDVSPVVTKPVVKGRGDSAWETLMNVAALVPPLPTEPEHARVVSAGTTATATPSPAKRDTINPGGSYSSQHRAANNDVVPNEQRWFDMFDRLELFKSKKGHCRVPNRYSGDPSLGSWVATQRRYMKNTNLPMPADRVKKLTDLGFEWTTKDPRKVPWETRFEDLQSFKSKFGHADVPHEWEECPQLGFWTANMRQQYRYKQLGKKSSLTDDRIELLNGIGFVWKMQGGRRKKSDPVARPNQSAPNSPLPPVLSRHHNGMGPTKLMLDPMSSVTSGVAMLGRAGTTSYIPPPSTPPISKQGQARSMPYAHAAL